eukprot:TRINITY_DN17707_c0_g1_i2.p1 TRINITY_DN17707_c0_g1~~TRINITY_DN17707_c0_g1_i2.p1  ORF type:complete len:307 (+),score=33.88 TRINITY_DN17707_c0_g1_i2:25-921(+)
MLKSIVCMLLRSVIGLCFFFFFKQKTAYEMQRGLVGSEMCIRDRYQRRVHGMIKKIIGQYIRIHLLGIQLISRQNMQYIFSLLFFLCALQLHLERQVTKMSTFMLKNSPLTFTPVSNIFIEKYMPKARGEFIKVYLLLLKHTISGEPGVSSSILASSLNLLETDIMNALNYWNDKGLIKLNKIDQMGNFNIEFVDLNEDLNKTNNQVDLLSALNSNSTKCMLQDIESLLARPLSPTEMSTYLNWQKEFGFSSELILILIEYCVSKGKSDSRYIEKVALSWHDLKITDIEQAQILIKKS